MEQQWDAVVVGAGMGGSAAAFQLAEAGHRVLIVERGPARPESASPSDDNAAGRLAAGHWPEKMRYVIDGEEIVIFPPLGAGVGGSTQHYAGALERLLRSDVEGETDADFIGEWPISYDELAQYYRAAEELFEVSGTQDPLAPEDANLLPPDSLCERDQNLFDRFEAAGLKPYRSHIAGRAGGPGLRSEKGRPSPLNARDLLESSVRPPHILDRAEIRRLVVSNGKVIAVEGVRHGQPLKIEGRNFVLAAGAIHTPGILLASGDADNPNGLCNASGLVGGNLMFHGLDLFLIWPTSRWTTGASERGICSSTLCSAAGKRLGLIQSMGAVVGYRAILQALRNLARTDLQRFIARADALRHLLFYGRPTLFCTIVEDLPYPENHVALSDPQGRDLRAIYNVPAEFRERMALMRDALSNALGRDRVLPFGGPTLLNLGHPCGTCAMGSDAEHSVVDPACRAHELDNLYIADASVFPTSGRVNPSLTVAALGLRVGTHLAANIAAEREAGNPMSPEHVNGRS